VQSAAPVQVGCPTGQDEGFVGAFVGESVGRLAQHMSRQWENPVPEQSLTSTQGGCPTGQDPAGFFVGALVAGFFVGALVAGFVGALVGTPVGEAVSVILKQHPSTQCCKP